MKINKNLFLFSVTVLIVIIGFIINKNQTNKTIRKEANVIIAIADSLMMIQWDKTSPSSNKQIQYILKQYEAALNKFKSINDQENEANTLIKISGNLLVLGRGWQNGTLIYRERALEIYRNLGNRKKESQTLYLIGGIYMGLLEDEKALNHYNQSLKISKEINDRMQESRALTQMGRIYLNRSNYTKALENFHTSLSIDEELEYNQAIVHTLNHIGEIYMELGENQMALEYLQKNLDYNHEMTNGYTFMYIGMAYRNLSKYTEALEYFQKSINNFMSYNGDYVMLAKAQSQMAETYYLQKNYSKSIQISNKSIETVNTLSHLLGFGSIPAYSHLTLAKTFIDKKEFIKAKENIESALNIALALNHNSLKQKLYSIFGDYYAEQNLDSLAIEKYKKSIEKADIIRDFLEVEAHKSGFMTTVIDVYKKLIAILIKQNRKSEAFKYLEQMKARVLLDILNQEKIDYSKVITPAESKTELSLISSIEKLTRKIHSNQQNQSDQKISLQLERENKQKELTAFQENLFIQYQGLREKRGRGQPIDSVENAQDLLDTEEAAIYFLPTHEYLFTFILTKEDFSILTVDISMNNINLSINQLLKGIKVLNWNLEHSKILYEILIDPITGIIKDKETLCIIPEGKLNYIPFQALLNSKRQKYLIEDHTIYYSPSLSSLKWLRTKTIKENKKLLAFGDCDFSGEKNINTMREKLIALPATGEEVKALNVIYSPNANIFLGSNATESNFNNQSTKFGIIHLATHSLVNEALPLFSSIALSKENGEDGFLEAREIIQMELNAQLVILSACKTAFGKQIAGEGMLGLTRAFFTAGIPSVVASLWQVEDNATKVLMVEFHKRLKEGKSPDLALRGAQIYMIKNSGYTDPVFWSPFILVGDNQ